MAWIHRFHRSSKASTVALTPINTAHALQIQAGVLGRKSGHEFEDRIANDTNRMRYPITFPSVLHEHVVTGDPAYRLLHYIASTFDHHAIQSATALSTGALATSENGTKWLKVNGVLINKCKSDIIITLRFPDGLERTTGVSTKQCNNSNPTNAQLFFTTAIGFSSLLSSNAMPVSDDAIHALRQFCGDPGCRPSDDPDLMQCRLVDPRRFFWEETLHTGRRELESIFTNHQDSITRLLLQKAYLHDHFRPDFLLHKTKRTPEWTQTEMAIYAMEELIAHSRNYAGFDVKRYTVRKGSYRDPSGTHHLAPRFGIVQMQRGGQAQHPEQLQFNLAAGYFYKLENRRPHMHSERARQ